MLRKQFLCVCEAMTHYTLTLSCPVKPTALSPTTGAVELPQGWAASTTEDGREYFYNTKTKQTQFTLPEVPLCH